VTLKDIFNIGSDDKILLTPISDMSDISFDDATNILTFSKDISLGN
jgi:hypothetical protein